ncbi:MAG: hypothetical protein RLZZ237_2251, partial [Pseudomonadota bacterium]
SEGDAMDSELNMQQQALVGKLYAAALDDAAWSDLCNDIALAFGAAGSAIVALPAASKKQFLGRSSNFTDAIISSYEDYYWQCDVWAEKGQQKGWSKIVASDDMINDRDFERTEFYADYCRQLDLFYVLGSVFPVAPDELGLLGIHRVRAQQHYSPQDKRQAEHLLPHLQRAMQIRHRLAQGSSNQRYSEQLLDTLGLAVLLLDVDAHVLFANALARALFGPDAQAGLHVGSKGCPRWIIAPALLQAVRAALPRQRAGAAPQVPAASSLRLPRPGAPGLQITVAPFQPPHGRFHASPCAIVIARGQQQSGVSIDALRQLFDLTPGESQVGLALAQGASLSEIASACGVSVNTVKTHLRHIFGKTGTCRQGELIALLHRCPPSPAPLQNIKAGLTQTDDAHRWPPA